MTDVPDRGGAGARRGAGMPGRVGPGWEVWLLRGLVLAVVAACLGLELWDGRQLRAMHAADDARHLALAREAAALAAEVAVLAENAEKPGGPDGNLSRVRMDGTDTADLFEALGVAAADLHRQHKALGRAQDAQFAALGRIQAAKIALLGLLLTGGTFLLSRRMAQRANVAAAGEARSARALAESDAQLHLVADNVREAVWVRDADTMRMLYVSRGVERLLGRTPDDLNGSGLDSIERTVHPDDRETVRAAYARCLREPVSLDLRVLRADGGVRPAHAKLFPVQDAGGRARQVVGVIEDITERRSAESAERRHRAALSRSTRLATVGEAGLALAHEFTQPLFAIGNYARGGLRHLARAGSPTPAVAEALEKVVAQADRSAEVIRRLRGLLAGEPLRTRPEDLNRLAAEAVRLAPAELPEGSARLSLWPSPDLPPVAADRIQVQQVILNLIRNAVEALEDRENGVVMVRTSVGKAGVTLTVSDNGPGIPEALAERMFDPFFTTRADGTGMGLAVSRTIIEAHEGRMWAAPAETGGAAVAFALPPLPEPETYDG